MRNLITVALLLTLGSSASCTQGPRGRYEPVFTRTKPLVFLGTVDGFHHEPAWGGKRLVVDVAVHEMACGDTVAIVRLAPNMQLVPGTNEISEVCCLEGTVFLAPGDRLVVAAQRHPTGDLYQINFIRFLGAPFEDREQYPLHQIDIGSASDSLSSNPALSIGERYALFRRKFEVDSIPLNERIDDLVSFYKASWWHYKYRWAHDDRTWRWRPIPPLD